MTAFSPETAGNPPQDPHLALAQFLDESVERAKLFFDGDRSLSMNPGHRFQIYTEQQFYGLLAQGTQTVNTILSDLGGTPVLYDDEITGTTVRGTVEGCTGFDKTTCQWKMVVNTPALAQLPGMQRLEVGFRLGEFYESYLRAKSSDDEPTGSYGFFPGRNLGRMGLRSSMQVRPPVWHFLPSPTGLLKN